MNKNSKTYLGKITTNGISSRVSGLYGKNTIAAKEMKTQ